MDDGKQHTGKPDLQTDQRPHVPRVAAKDLFGQRKEIEIEHEGSVYRLRITRLGKLILNK
ncbi:MAG: hemin uptake protein HemP [Pseudomonadota bacterium]